MIVKYLSKFVLDVLPSVAATIIGAYIVNHYIVARPAADAPVAATVSTVEPKKADARSADRNADKRIETPSDKAVVAKAAVEKAAVEKVPLEKSAEEPMETASLPADTRRHQPPAREKTVAKTPVSAAATASVTAPLEANPAQDDRRDANDMARAAIERLRGSSEAAHAADAPRAADTPRVASAPPQPVPPLPPAITVATPSGDGFNPPRPPYVPVARIDDPLRPTPPADIPIVSRPLDLHAEATGSTPGRTTVADDVLSAAKSVFHAVLPR
jgi:hypothetical protein